jgi:hypothetical protein
MALIDGLYVMVQQHQWDKVKAGDQEAIKALAKKLDGVDVYFHALSLPDPENDDPKNYWIPIFVSTLFDLGVIERVTLHAEE